MADLEAPIDWAKIRLVVFDVDGTLYRQTPVRIKMALALLSESVRKRSFAALKILRHYRVHREHYDGARDEAFETVLARDVAKRLGVSAEVVTEVVAEWIQQRPLGLLLGARYREIDSLFDRIRSSGRKIGILSDYPAATKVEALGLRADHIVCAEEIGALKPSPAGLLHVIDVAGERPDTSVLIGDRADRDGEAGRRGGVPVLLRSSRPVPGYRTFKRYDDPIFHDLRSPVTERRV